jgi:hypothetical protein
MLRRAGIVLWLLFLASCATTGGRPGASPDYQATVAKWTSYQDVADWMRANFYYVPRKAKSWQPRAPQETFASGRGMCQDASNFARDALNRINPSYRARIVYIENRLGPPHHWVTAFTADGKLYVMDYGAGARWSSMMGVHGPYDSLVEYERFLSSLRMQGFALSYARETEF